MGPSAAMLHLLMGRTDELRSGSQKLTNVDQWPDMLGSLSHASRARLLSTHRDVQLIGAADIL